MAWLAKSNVTVNLRSTPRPMLPASTRSAKAPFFVMITSPALTDQRRAAQPERLESHAVRAIGSADADETAGDGIAFGRDRGMQRHEGAVEQHVAAVPGIDDKRRVDQIVHAKHRLRNFAIRIELYAIAGRHERSRRSESHHVMGEIELHHADGKERIAEDAVEVHAVRGVAQIDRRDHEIVERCGADLQMLEMRDVHTARARGAAHFERAFFEQASGFGESRIEQHVAGASIDQERIRFAGDRDAARDAQSIIDQRDGLHAVGDELTALERREQRGIDRLRELDRRGLLHRIEGVFAIGGDRTERDLHPADIAPIRCVNRRRTVAVEIFRAQR